jgi:divalent metal cation (Fe/Co/Zn/Cd) transporter
VYLGVNILDPIGGVIVSSIIFYVSIKIIRSSVNVLLGEKPEGDFIDTIAHYASGVEGVWGIHGITVHDYGTKKVVSMHIQVDKTMSTEASHEVANDVEKSIKENVDGVISTVVHIEPASAPITYAAEKKKKKEHEEQINKVEKVIFRQKDVIAFHKLRISGDAGHAVLSVHIFLDKETNIEDAHALTHRLERNIKKIFGGRIRIHLEPCDEKCDTCDTICKKRGADYAKKK